MLVFGGLSTYSYVDIKEETNNSTYAKNISLANLIVCFLFSVMIAVLFYMKYLSINRTFIISLFIILIISILFALNYYFLEEERKDTTGYQAAHDNLKDNTNRYNIDFLTLNLILAIVGFAFVILFCVYSYAKMYNYNQEDHNLFVNNKTLVIDNLDSSGDNERIKRVLIM
tara:strand:+ start:202 stop:714 length:513 start_codon:yes stop_codon:yes gene_type:complete